MTTHVVKVPADFPAAVKAARANDIIKLAPGVVIPPQFLPDMVFDPKTPVTFTSVSETDQGVLQSLVINDNQSGLTKMMRPLGKQWRGLVFEGVTVSAPASNKFKLASGDTVTLKKSVGWRCDAKYPGIDVGNQNSGMTGIDIGSGASDIIFSGVRFEGYGKALKISNPKRVTAEYCDFLRNCEDMIMFWGGDDITIRYCRQVEFDGLDYEDAHAIGWIKDGPAIGGVPPHSDFIQGAANSQGGFLRIIGNVMRDDTGRVHGILLNNPNGGIPYNNVLIADNRFDMTHTTAIYGGNATGFECVRNKVVRTKELPSPPNPKGKNDTKIEFKNLHGKVVITDNECRKFHLAEAEKVAGSVVERNVATNDTVAGFKGYVELRPGIAKPGALRAGVGGKTGKPPVEPPVEPPIDLPPQPVPTPAFVELSQMFREIAHENPRFAALCLAIAEKLNPA